MPKLKPGTIIPTPEDDAEINRGIAADPDTYELSHEEFRQLRRVGRPPSERPKRMVSLRLDQDVVDGLRATGPGWQSRVNAALKEWLEGQRVE